MKNPIQPVIAVSNKSFSSIQELLDYCLKKNLCGIDYTFDSNAINVSDLQRETANIEKIAKEGFEIRYHFQFYSMEIAHADMKKAKRSLEFHKDCIDFTSNFRGKYATIHIGLGIKSINELKYENALANLSELVVYGKEKQITVCLENLTRGWTNNPYSFLEMIEKTGASVTFDLGHANACPWVVDNQGTSVEFLRTFASHVINAHVYEIEKVNDKTLEPYHVAPRKLDFIRPLLSELIRTKCDWWLIELKAQEEVDNTRSLLQSFLDKTLRQTK
ncbi:MAG: TIM barrel protein [Pseudomonadota bacterium]